MSHRHIVHLTSVHPPFDPRIFYKECQTLVKGGYKVTLIAPYKQDEVVDGVQIVAVPEATGRLQRVTSTVAHVCRKALQQAAKVYHFHDPELIPVGLLLEARGKRVIYDIHEDVPRSLFALSRDYLPNYAKRPSSWLVERLENLAARRFSALIAATPTIGQRFQALNRNTCVINNFPILNELALPVDIHWDKRLPATAYVGGIALDRGSRQMVEAMAYFRDRPQIKLKLAGNFSPPQHRKDLVKLPGWQGVDELGFLGRNEVAHLLGQVRVGLAVFPPTPNLVTAQPVKLFEYMAAGIPVVVSDFPLWRQLIEQTGCGLLVDPLEPIAIARAIEYLLTHSDEAEAMGSRGREAVEKYNWETEAAKLIQLYDNLLTNRH